MKSKKLYELPVISVYNADSTVALPTNGPAGNTTLKEALIAGLRNYDRFTSGAGQNITLKASDGFTSGAGGSIILQPGAQANTGGDGVSIIKQTAASSYANFAELKTSANSLLGSVNNGGTFIVPSVTTNLTTSQNDLALGNQRVHRINCTVASDITGIAPATGTSHLDGREIRLYNTGTANITLKHASSSSTAANRLYAFNVSPSRSASFNGSSQWLQVSHNTSLAGYSNGDFFISVWIYPTSTATSQTIVAKYNTSDTTNDASFRLNFEGSPYNRIIVDRYAADGTYTNNLGVVSSVTLNTWHHIFTYGNGTQTLMFINAVARNGAANNGGNGGLRTSADPLYVGRNKSVGYNFGGKIDSLVYGRVPLSWAGLSPTTTASWFYNSGAGVSENALKTSVYAPYVISAWGLDESGGTRYDSVGTNHLADNGSTLFADGKVLTPGNDVIIYPGEYAELIYDSTDNGNGMAGWRMI